MLSGLGLTTVFLAFSKWYFDQYRWKKFNRITQNWTLVLLEAEEKSAQRHPQEIEEEEWEAICERFLSDSHFTPAEIAQILKIAVLVMKRVAADKFSI